VPNGVIARFLVHGMSSDIGCLSGINNFENIAVIYSVSGYFSQ
jgi:hypothetical protein